MVNYDVERGITVFTSSGGSSAVKPEGSSEDGVGPSPGKTKSQFVIAEATPADSGNYTCKPSNAVPASIQVFVSNTRGNVSLYLLMCTQPLFVMLFAFPPSVYAYLSTKSGKDKSPCPCSYPQKPIWIVSSVIGHFGSLTMLSEYYNYPYILWIPNGLRKLQVFSSNQRNTIRHSRQKCLWFSFEICRRCTMHSRLNIDLKC